VDIFLQLYRKNGEYSLIDDLISPNDSKSLLSRKIIEIHKIVAGSLFGQIADKSPGRRTRYKDIFIFASNKTIEKYYLIVILDIILSVEYLPMRKCYGFFQEKDAYRPGPHLRLSS